MAGDAGRRRSRTFLETVRRLGRFLWRLDMGKGTYSGGGTIIHPGDEGTRWDSTDPAENRRRRVRKNRRHEYKSVTKKEIEVEAERESRMERKILRNFISQCAAAHLISRLTATDPVAPTSLRKRIKNAGGNVSWLEGNRTYQVLFHEAYCRLRNEPVPFEKVWKSHDR
jgi:hypothetical protein